MLHHCFVINTPTHALGRVEFLAQTQPKLFIGYIFGSSAGGLHPFVYKGSKHMPVVVHAKNGATTSRTCQYCHSWACQCKLNWQKRSKFSDFTPGYKIRGIAASAARWL
jgi:hypothetical protein